MKNKNDQNTGRRKTSRRRRGVKTPRTNENSVSAGVNTLQESIDISVRAALVDSRDEKFFGVTNDFTKTMEAFMPNTVCNASRFPGKYYVEGIAQGKVLPPPPKSSLRHRRMTYDAYSERNIKWF